MAPAGRGTGSAILALPNRLNLSPSLTQCDHMRMTEEIEQCYPLNYLEKKLSVDRRTLFRAIKDKRLAAFKIGSDWRVTVSAIRDFQKKTSNIEA